MSVMSRDADDFISLTDIARYKDSQRTDYLIQNWLKNRNTIELLGIWEHSTTPVSISSNSMGLGVRRDSTTTVGWRRCTTATFDVSNAWRYYPAP